MGNKVITIERLKVIYKSLVEMKKIEEMKAMMKKIGEEVGITEMNVE
jgi:hypothetical protein